MVFRRLIQSFIFFPCWAVVSCTLPRDNKLDKNSPYYIACTTNPVNGLTVLSITRNSVFLSWSSVANAKGYFVVYRINGGSSWYTMTVYTNGAEIKSLLANTNYEAKIQTYCDGGYLYVNSLNSSNSSNVTFKTLQY
jgi:hypothetical protein